MVGKGQRTGWARGGGKMLGAVGAGWHWVGCGWEAGVWWGGWGEVNQEGIGYRVWIGKGWLERVGKVGWAGHTGEGGGGWLY